MGMYLEYGRTPHETATDMAAVGVMVPWTVFGFGQSGASSLYWDFFIGNWRGPTPDQSETRSYTQIGAIANWRYRFGEGTSPWFTELGIGGTLMDSMYHTPARTWSTRFQFSEHLGVGRSFGQRGEHEVSVRIQHLSNANIKKPNPGENFVRVRYMYRF